MKKQFYPFHFMIFCVLIISLFHRSHAQTTITQNSKWWNDVTNEVKMGYVTGFFDGVRDVQTYLTTMREKKEVVIQRDPITGINRTVETEDTPKQKSIRELDDYCRNVLEQFSVEQYVAGLDKFYSDKLNAMIRVNDAMEVVRMQLRNKNPKEINAHIKYLRGDASPDMK